MEPRRVCDLMRRSFIRVAPDEGFEDVRRLMAMARVRELPVLEGDRLAGMVCQRDLARAALSNAQAGLAPVVGETIARFVRPVKPISSEALVAEAARQMLGEEHPCLPAVETRDGELHMVGLLVEGDLLRAAYDPPPTP